MNVKIKRIDKTLPLPEFKTKGAAAFDFISREDVLIPPHSIGYVPLNVIIEIPEGCVMFIFARSGMHKRGLMLANGVGVIDPDLCGEKDENKAVCFNFTDNEVTVQRGERIAQGLIQERAAVQWEEVEKMKEESRGAFGTTGDR